MTPLVGVPPVVEDARRALAALVGAEGAESMFDSLVKMYRRKGDAEVENQTRRLLEAHDLAWPPEPPTPTTAEVDAPSEGEEPTCRGQAKNESTNAALAAATEPTKPTTDKPYTLAGGKFWSYDAIFDPNLVVSSDARLVLLYLCRRANKDGICWPSHRGVAECTGVASSSVPRLLIPELAAHGLIKHERGTSLYRIQDPKEWRLHTDAECCVRAAKRIAKAKKAAEARWASNDTEESGPARQPGRADPFALAALFGPDWSGTDVGE